MVAIVPFCGIRPVPDLAPRVASLPYDVMSTAEARQMAAGNPLSFLHVIKPEIDLPDDTDPYDDAVYAAGKRAFLKLLEDGVLRRDPQPAFYVYRQEMQYRGTLHVQTGLVAGASVAEYEAGVIRKHELTRVAKEQDRTRHVDSLNAQTGPVFLTYRSQPEINALIEACCTAQPEVDFTAEDGIRHVVWPVADPDRIAQLQQAFAAVPRLYIADGHHRAASAATVGRTRREANPNHTGDEPYNSFLSVMFPHNQMMVLDYNRVVRDLNGMQPQAFLKALDDVFTVTETTTPRPDREHVFGMYLDGRWYRLELHSDLYADKDPVEVLDVALLQDLVLAPLLDIGDPRVDERIDFVGGIRGLGELERRVNAGEAVAFALFPTPIERLFAVADRNQVMPPKSTWFEPKLRSGLVVKSLD